MDRDLGLRTAAFVGLNGLHFLSHFLNELLGESFPFFLTIAARILRCLVRHFQGSFVNVINFMINSGPNPGRFCKLSIL
jgi:hypothetical protein